MWNNNDNNNGYTRGGRDVTESVNLFIKIILLSPIIVLAAAVSVGMIKNLLFMGIPTINTPSNEQIEQIRQRDRQIVPENMYQPQHSVVPQRSVQPSVAPVWRNKPAQVVSTHKYTRVRCEADLSKLAVSEGPVYDALKNTCTSI